MGRWDRPYSEKAFDDKKVGKKCPLGWYVEIDSESDSIEMKFIYLAHNRVDTDFYPKKYELDYSFDKQEIIDMIPEQACIDPFYLANYIGALDDRRWKITQYITKNLAEDFEEVQVNAKSASQKYNGIARVFSSDEKYKRPLEALMRQEALLHLLRKPRTFQGRDIREEM